MIVERKEREVTENESGVRSRFPIGRLYRTKVYVCMLYTQPRLSSRASHVSTSRSVPNPSRARAVHDNAAYDRASTREQRGMCVRI